MKKIYKGDLQSAEKLVSITFGLCGRCHDGSAAGLPVQKAQRRR
jgi:hypothetical protein